MSTMPVASSTRLGDVVLRGDEPDFLVLERLFGAYQGGDLGVGRVERSKMVGHRVSSVDTQAHGVRVDRSPVVDPTIYAPVATPRS